MANCYPARWLARETTSRARLHRGGVAPTLSRVLYGVLRTVHLLAMIVWLGTGLSIPVVADVKRTLALDGRVHGPPLIARLKLTTQLVVPAAVVTVATGFAMIFERGGFALVPVRIHIGLALALAVFAVGGAFTRRQINALAQGLTEGDSAASQRAGKRIAWGLRLEDVLRLSALLLMSLPLENWL